GTARVLESRPPQKRLGSDRVGFGDFVDLASGEQFIRRLGGEVVGFRRTALVKKQLGQSEPVLAGVGLLADLGAQGGGFLVILSCLGEVPRLVLDVTKGWERTGATALARGLLGELERLPAAASRSGQISRRRLSVGQTN